MSGLISLQIRITGNLEQDQQILLYGIGGLIGLIILTMIIIVIVVIVRKGKRKKAAEQYVVPELVYDKPVVAEAVKEAVPIEPKPEPVQPEIRQEPVAPVVEEKKEEVQAAVEVKPEPKVEVPVQKVEEPLVNKDDKLEEIRRRLEEIRSQKVSNEPSIVLPKIEAAPITPAQEPEKEEEPEKEVTLVEDSEAVVVPIQETVEVIETISREGKLSSEENEEEESKESILEEENAPIMVEDEGVMREIVPELEAELETENTISVQQVDIEIKPVNFPNGKFLPMKKMTFAEWVELFK